MNRHDAVNQLAEFANKLRPFLNDAGATNIAGRQTKLVEQWSELQLRAEQASYRIALACQQKEDFWNKFDKFEDQLGSAGEQLDRLREIYTDEAHVAGNAIQVYVMVMSSNTVIHSNGDIWETVEQ